MRLKARSSRPCYRVQTSTRSPATRSNLLAFADTKTAFRRTICAAISGSYAPIGVQARSSCARIRPPTLPTSINRFRVRCAAEPSANRRSCLSLLHLMLPALPQPRVTRRPKFGTRVIIRTCFVIVERPEPAETVDRARILAHDERASRPRWRRPPRWLRRCAPRRARLSPSASRASRRSAPLRASTHPGTPRASPKTPASCSSIDISPRTAPRRLHPRRHPQHRPV